MEDFTRPFTDEEFLEVFRNSGYAEIGFQYCKEQYERWFNEMLNECTKKYGNPIDDKIPLDQIRESLSCKKATIREDAWRDVQDLSYVEEYISERNNGQSHEWAKIYAENYEDYYRQNWIYTYTHFELGKINSQLAEQDLEKLICRISQGNDIWKRYLREGTYEKDSIDEVIDNLPHFHTKHQDLIAKGYDEHYSYMLAKLRTLRDYYTEVYCVEYAEVYSREIAAGADKEQANDIAFNETEIFSERYYDGGWELDKSKTYAKAYIKLKAEGKQKHKLMQAAMEATWPTEYKRYHELYDEFVKKGMDKFEADKEASIIAFKLIPR